MNIFIVGLGLIGGSLAKALKKNSECIIYAYDSNEETIKTALAGKTIDFGYTDLDKKKFDCDIVIIATPPALVVPMIKTLIPHLNSDAIFSDVCSVKGIVMSEIKELRENNSFNFVGGHPMAGTENSGYKNSVSTLFKNAFYVVTEENEKINKMIEIIGAKKIVIPEDSHDYLVGVISHIPHIVSAALVNLANENDSEEHILQKLAGGGFRDITRISSSSEFMWQQIIFNNKDNMIDLLLKFENIIKTFREDLENNDIDNVTEHFRRAREYRGQIK
jgi:prephenate dehydrogenase